MINFKINFPTLQDIIVDTDPELHEKAFVKASNDVFSRALPKIVTRIKQKFNLGVQKPSPYEFLFTSALTGITRKRSGRIRFFKAGKNGDTIKIITKGDSIDDYLFNYSYADELAMSRNKRRKKSLIKKVRGQKKKVRPRVKILKKGTPVILTGKTFYAKMESGHFGIFRRRSDKKIIELRTITLVSMMEQVNYEKIFDDHYQKNMPKRYSHYLKGLMKGSTWT